MKLFKHFFLIFDFNTLQYLKKNKQGSNEHDIYGERTRFTK
jgi:hypothetical protein